ncbi:MAG: hypothetical protein N4A33_01760 [Bacteriovoracaceae bacterium]|jgi:hypothetical protein|nr:hypothetical protein [Bacteriovoracaceae bacterium]
MRKLLIGLLALGSLSSFAGSISNKRTTETITNDVIRETITFDVIAETQELEIKSNTPKLDSGFIRLEALSDRQYYESYLADFQGRVYDEIYFDYQTEYQTSAILLAYLTPIYNIPMIGALAADIVVLPFKVSIGVIKTLNFKKDYKILKKAINSDEDVVVGNKRFKRIIKLLKNNIL